MKNFQKICIPLSLALSSAAFSQPEPLREFRGTWVASVSNLDWPVRGDSPREQKEDLQDMLDDLQDKNINAIIFQVRSECDSLYDSPFEPWSRYLTGSQGLAPDPYWDPLEFAIDEARRRGMELHAWINPYRAGISRSSSFSSQHVSRNGTPFVVNFENNFWLDPGHPDTVSYTVDIVEDIVSRYDVDGFHYDDYFYPYTTNSSGFPDDQTFQTNNPQNLSLDDWRRANTRELIESTYSRIRNIPGREHVEFGISPFGIYRPGIPSGISGLDSYSAIYINSREWLRDGIMDYVNPQLYWGRQADGYSSLQDYDTLIEWWASPSQNPLDRNLYGGLPAYKVANGQLTNPQHVVNQIEVTRNTPGADGVVHFRADNLNSNSVGIGPILEADLWSQPDALKPASPWLDDTSPDSPEAFWDIVNDEILLYIPRQNYDTVVENPRYVIQSFDGQWKTEVSISRQHTWTFPINVSQIAIRSVDRSGNLSPVVSFNTNGQPTGLPTIDDWTLIENFESATLNTSQFMFRSPGVSGSSRNLASGSSSRITNEDFNNRLDPMAYAPGTRSLRLGLDFLSAGDGRARVTTINSTGRPNPQIDLNDGLTFAIRIPEGSLDVSLIIRETGTTGPIGANGGTSGGLERTAPIRLEASGSWQTLYFDLNRIQYESFSGGDGKLDGNFGVLEALLIEAVEGEPVTDYEVYIDDFYQGPMPMPFGKPLLAFSPDDVEINGFRFY